MGICGCLEQVQILVAHRGEYHAEHLGVGRAVGKSQGDKGAHAGRWLLTLEDSLGLGDVRRQGLKREVRIRQAPDRLPRDFALMATEAVHHPAALTVVDDAQRRPVGILRIGNQSVARIGKLPPLAGRRLFGLRLEFRRPDFPQSIEQLRFEIDWCVSLRAQSPQAASCGRFASGRRLSNDNRNRCGFLYRIFRTHDQRVVRQHPAYANREQTTETTRHEHHPQILMVCVAGAAQDTRPPLARHSNHPPAATTRIAVPEERGPANHAFTASELICVE